MKSYIERRSISVENEILRDRCRLAIREARSAKALLNSNRYYSKPELDALRAHLDKIINA